ncbi:hypothetical protein GV64_19655 [Endozoicomonas elysicola]|uniref:Uncharacterized protein n=1 Tax=Endozoicomonas elysicola TaxID=305900 RepID=A0A081KES6_9GAMM|nr:hypothetical protein GV64_19655 [Endozoicomonas elysicola]
MMAAFKKFHNSVSTMEGYVHLLPEIVTHKYRILAKVIYVEESKARTRHYRCLINEKDRLPKDGK